jgi:type VI protein secretion system component Hcp
MSVEIFLKLDGIAGSTRNFSHKGWADVTSWSWDMQSNRNSAYPVDGEKTALRMITIVKRIGIDSADMMSAFALGKTIATAELDIVPVVAKREAKQKYLSIHMEDVRIKSIVTGGSSADEFFNETVVLLFARVRYEFSLNATIGSDLPAGEFRFAWDINQAKIWE